MNPRRIYIIHEHHAHKVHWDLRLEKNGVLVSWALPKEPPRQIGIKRLAIQVEDHSLEYASFEGKIFEGYGAGEVRIWDQGSFKEEKWTNKEIVININGKKLKRRHVLLKFKPKEKNWLFFKID